MLAKGVVVAGPASWTGPWFGATRATALQRVANRPIICHVLDALREAGVTEVAIAAPRDLGAEISLTIEDERTPEVTLRYLSGDAPDTTEDALRAAADFVGDAPCVLHCADGLLGEPIEALLGAHPDPHDVALLVGSGAPVGRRLRLAPAGGRAGEELDPVLGASGVPGACVLGAGELRRVASASSPPPLADFAAIAAQLGREGRRTHVQLAGRFRRFAGQAADLLDMNRAVLETLSCEVPPGEDDGNHFEGNVDIHPTAQLNSSIIIGPVIIGAGALISDSYIGPHTSIAERVRIEGAELERSIVLADASVLHVRSRLVSCVVGQRARIFRDFSMPRALRLQVGYGDEVALC